MFHLHVWESVANNLIYSDLIRLFIYLRIVETVVSETAVSELCIIAMRKRLIFSIERMENNHLSL